MRPRQVTDEQILEAARACFLEHGPSVSTSVIAKHLGVSSAALFKRFNTKEELMVAALLPMATPPFLPLIEAGPDERPALEQLGELASAMHAHLQRTVPCLAILRAAGVHLCDVVKAFETPPPVRVLKALTGWFERASQRGLIRELPAEVAATAFMGIMHIRPFWTHHLQTTWQPEAPMEVYLDEALRTFCRGLEVEETP